MSTQATPIAKRIGDPPAAVRSEHVRQAMAGGPVAFSSLG